MVKGSWFTGWGKGPWFTGWNFEFGSNGSGLRVQGLDFRVYGL